MYATNPGLFHDDPPAVPPPAEEGGVVGIVADSYEQAAAYVTSAPMPSPYRVILRADDVAGVRLAGLALLTTQPLSMTMREVLTMACDTAE